MRLLMFDDGSGPRLGALRDASARDVVDLRALAAAAGAAPPPRDVLAVIDAGPAGLERVRELLAGLGPSADPAVARPLGDVTLLAPLDPPRGNVLAVGRNYARHAEEGARARGTEVGPPTIFTKAITTITGPCADIPLDASISEQVDWEVELGIVVGRRGANIARRDALGHVFGYTVLNDITARDIQHGWGGQWFKGKSVDASCPTGPWVVTADELSDPGSLRLRLLVNGVVKQDASTRDMIYPVDAIVEWLSFGMTLLPGMLIASGTPEGVGFARQPPEFLRPGDVVEASVEGVGTLRNRMVAAAPRTS
ncbi:MAG TPA: fumarylacetoacetate hydrolase family protein [Candidatus Dormibacteraeota bacterium]|nr:fumarylacetoacetate hydrolase family protein [Candidatus Dormibacteraeota bacterium]